MAKRASTPHDILAKYWGYSSFRPLQEEIITDILSGKDTLALMPTGGGKSITYQVPALLKRGICIVVTPLISLMVDQVEALRRKGIGALSLHSGMTAREIDITMDNALFGNYKFLYLSPERVATKIFRERLIRMDVSFLAIDEAHCISQWGYDFRPSYLRLSQIRELLPDVPVLAVTATATNEVAEDIMYRLSFSKPNIKRTSFARSNLSYIVRNTEDKEGHLLRIVGSLSGSGIVYCRTRKECERVSIILNEHGESSDFYHGGVDYHLRKAKQKEWLSDSTRIMVATNAFGMGIDKAAVRFIVHFDTPDSPEAYYQEAGRAGRDGKEAFAVLLTSGVDVSMAQQRIERSFPKLEEIRHIYNMICNYLQVAIGEGQGMPFDFNVYDFSSKFSLFSANVLSAIKILELNGYITLTDDLDNPARIMFQVSREELYKISLARRDLEGFINVILRIYPGLFTVYVAISVEYISKLSGYTADSIRESLKSLSQLRIINYIPARNTPLLIFHEERLSDYNLRISPESYSFRLERSLKRSQSMAEFATHPICRPLQLRRYFGEECDDKCGKCDVCRDERKASMLPMADRILAKLEEGACDIKDLRSSIAGDSRQLSSAILSLIESGTIAQEDSGKLSLVIEKSN